MASITKLPNGTYKARWRTPDGKSRSQVFTHKGLAEDYLTAVEGTKLSGDYIDRSAGAVTLAEFGPGWIATRRTPKGTVLRPRTQDLYEQQFRCHLEPKIGALALRDITPATVRAWRAELPDNVASAKASDCSGR